MSDGTMHICKQYTENAVWRNGLCKRNEISGTMVGNKSREVSAPLDQLHTCCYILAANKDSPSGRQRHLWTTAVLLRYLVCC